MSRRERQRRRRRSRGGPAKIIFLSLGVVTAGLVIGILSLVGYIVSVASSGPDLADLPAKTQGSNSIIYAADGTRLGVIQADTLRTQISSRLMPRAVRQATVAIEDRRFFEHGGVDFEGVVRAAFKNFQSSDKSVQGGSTLTMQLIKNLYTGNRTRTGWAGYKRKIREAKLAEQLENVHPDKRGKEWILTKYLNNVPYGTVGGQTAYGIQAAARIFFNKRARELTLGESALLAGLPQAPSLYNPFTQPERATARRNDVLHQMRRAGYITADEEAAAAAAPIRVKKTAYYRDKREAYFFDYVRSELVRQYGIDKVREGGLRVYTTIDLRLQKLARGAIRKSLAAPGSPAAALVSIDPKTGWIKAMATSQKYSDSKFNLAAQGKRQPGSTFKVIVLMAAIRRGVDINRTSYMSKPLDFTWHGTPIKVTNSDGAASGHAKTLFQAVVSSDNTVFQQLDLDVGPPNVTQTAYDMGITSKLDSYPAEGLGGLTYGVTPLEMARAYVTVNDGGYRLKPVAIRKVVLSDGKVDTKLSRTRRVKVFTDGETNEAIQAMKANVRSGTGTAANLGFCPAAGKTGTTSNFVDAWFNGMTRNLNTTVWVGYPKVNTSMSNVPNWGTMFGGKAPATIWHDFMVNAVNRKTCGDWPKPTTPFVAKPFFGELSVSGGKSSSDIFDNKAPLSPRPDTTAGQKDGAGTGQGGQKYPPGQYESQPQKAPQTQKPAATPTPTPTPTQTTPAPPADNGGAAAGGAAPPP